MDIDISNVGGASVIMPCQPTDFKAGWHVGGLPEHATARAHVVQSASTCFLLLM